MSEITQQGLLLAMQSRKTTVTKYYRSLKISGLEFYQWLNSQDGKFLEQYYAEIAALNLGFETTQQHFLMLLQDKKCAVRKLAPFYNISEGTMHKWFKRQDEAFRTIVFNLIKTYKKDKVNYNNVGSKWDIQVERAKKVQMAAIPDRDIVLPIGNQRLLSHFDATA